MGEGGPGAGLGGGKGNCWGSWEPSKHLHVAACATADGTCHPHRLKLISPMTGWKYAATCAAMKGSLSSFQQQSRADICSTAEQTAAGNFPAGDHPHVATRGQEGGGPKLLLLTHLMILKYRCRFWHLRLSGGATTIDRPSAAPLPPPRLLPPPLAASKFAVYPVDNAVQLATLCSSLGRRCMLCCKTWACTPQTWLLLFVQKLRCCLQHECEGDGHLPVTCLHAQSRHITVNPSSTWKQASVSSFVSLYLPAYPTETHYCQPI